MLCLSVSAAALVSLPKAALAAVDPAARGLGTRAQKLAVQSGGLYPIGCRTGFNFNRSVTTDALPVFLSRSRHILPYGARCLAPVYAGDYAGVAEKLTSGFSAVNIGFAPSWNAPAANTFNVGAIRRVTLRGKFGITIPSGEYAICDPIGVNIAPGAAVGLHVYGSASTAQPIVGGLEICRSKTWGEEFAKTFAAGASDLSLTSSSWPAADNNVRGALMPAVILGKCADGIKRSSVAVIGHSIVAGQVSGGGLNSRDTGDDDGNIGWIQRTLASTRPFGNYATPGDKLQYWMGTNSNDAANMRFALLSLGWTDAIVQLEINDFGDITVNNYELIYRAFVQRLIGLGIRVHAVTPSPQSNSSDTWATLANQTKSAASDMVVDWAARLRASAVSTWGCTSVIDLNALLCDPTSTWAWRTDINGALGIAPTGDGTHPSQALNVWIAQQQLFNPLTLIPEFPA